MLMTMERHINMYRVVCTLQGTGVKWCPPLGIEQVASISYHPAYILSIIPLPKCWSNHAERGWLHLTKEGPQNHIGQDITNLSLL